jgi:predicted nuclease of predicted toxin-antitoxin system
LAKRLGHRDATDLASFDAARHASAVVMTKDGDFVRLLYDHGPPPQTHWTRLGNTSNARIRAVLEATFDRAMSLLLSGKRWVRCATTPRRPARLRLPNKA